MNNILIPEKNNTLLKSYHTSSKLLLPFVGGYVLSKNMENKWAENIFYTANIVNFAYHSYVSMSCVITDYIKPRTLSNVTRSLSLVIHGTALYGYLKNVIKK